jgi:hypothetical protein
LQLAHVNASLKDIQYFLNTPSANLTLTQRDKSINEQNLLTKEHSFLRERLTQLYKEEEQININTLITEAKQTIYPPNNKNCHMKWENKTVKKNH